MSGFVGSRARKRRRNTLLSIGVIVLIVIIVLSFPNFETQNNEIIPNDNIVPDPTVELTSLASNVEELELNLFQKDQKIKFRDGQIKNLQTELKKTMLMYNETILELDEIKGNFRKSYKSLINSGLRKWNTGILDKSNNIFTWLIVKLKEGKNCEIRNICKYFSWPIVRLIRIQYGPYKLEKLKIGQIEEIQVRDNA